MRDIKKPKEQLINEPKQMRQRISELEKLNTEREQAEKVLRESEGQYRDLLDDANDLIQSVAPDSHFLYVNRTWQKVLGYSNEDIANLTLWDIIHPDSRYRCREAFQKVLLGETINNIEAVFVAKDGKLVSVEGNINCRFVDGKPFATRGIFRDITERKQAGDKLRESERRYRLLAENAGDVIWTVDMNMRPTYISPSMTRLLGYSIDEAMAKTMEEVFTPASYEVAMKVLAEELATEKMEQKDLFRPRVLELALKRKDGSIVPVEIGYSFLRDADAQPTGVLAIARDITERKRAQEEVRRARDDYLSITNLTGDIIVKLDTEGRWTFVNDGACQFWGKPRRELIGRDFSDYLHPDDQEIAIAAVKQFKSNKLVKGLVNRQKTPKGWRTIEWNAAAIFDEEGRYTGFQATGRDITERKHQEAKIEHLNQLLRAVFYVSGFIFREKDRNILIKRVCDTLAESQVFRYAWVALLDEAKMPVATAEAGLGKDFLTLVKRWKLGKLPACGQKALQQSELVVSRESLSDCDGCPLADKHTSDSVLTIRLEYDGKVYGLLSCCTIDRYGLGEEEQGLLQRIAGDIAFALHDAEVENQHRRAVDSLVEMTRLL